MWKLPNHIKSVHEKIKEYACDQCDHKTVLQATWIFTSEQFINRSRGLPVRSVITKQQQTEL